MKTLIKTILQLSLFATLLFGMGTFADASFVANPWVDGKGTTTVGLTDNSGSDTDSLPGLGANKEFYAFIAYQNGTNAYTLNDVTARFDFPTVGTGSSVTVKGRLGATNGSERSDTATVNGLPSSWTLDLVSAYVYNNHGAAYPSCTPMAAYNYDISVSDSGISNNWVTLPGGANKLDIFATSAVNGFLGACDQGHVVAKFKITETVVEDTDTVPIVRTEEASSVGMYTAQLNGSVLLGSVTNPYFIWSLSPSVSCAAIGATVYGTYETGESFNNDIDGLLPGTTYYYRACGPHDGSYVSGVVKNFTTDTEGGDGGGGAGEDTPEAHTDGADDVDADSAELNGDVDMHDFANGEVFFVWGQNEGDIEDVADEDSYSGIDEDGDNLQKELVDDDLDGADDYALDIDGLDENEDYYFRICVEYYDGGSQLECGSVDHFDTNTDDGGDDGDSEIETRDVEVGSTRAEMCGDLIHDGGDSSLKTWIEYRKATSGTWSDTTHIDRGEVYYCVTVTGLDTQTAYRYRACSEDSCGDQKNFTTVGELPTGAIAKPLVSTDTPTNIASTSALLNGFYVSNADSLNVWFNYGRTPELGSQTRTYDKFGANGSMSHNFTGLATNTTYYYQAAARNTKGTAVGNILSFKTGGGSGSVVVVKKLEDETIDLAKLGLGLSLIRLEIDNDREQVVRGENIEYVVSWENISTLDLTNIDLKITLPDEVEITNTSRGIFDADQNAIFYTIDELKNGEDGELTVFATVTDGVLGSALTAEAATAFNNPVNDAQENATDYDIDELVVRNSLGTASVFGLSNISFLGWLVILLGLLIIFLVARWLYLEREELRAQAYAGGYGRPAPTPAYNYAPPVQAVPPQPVYQAPAPTYQAPVVNTPAPAPTVVEPGYKPYRPNR